jgi:endonuclease-8
MSEGPEVRRTADRLEAALSGRVLEAVELRRRVPLDAEVARRLRGARVRAVRTYGKHLVIEFTRGVFLHNHMMMFGKWRTYARSDYDSGSARPPPRVRRFGSPHPKRGPTVTDVRGDSRVRLVLFTRETVAVEFNGPVLRFMREDPAEQPSIQRLGPDGLAPRFAFAEARRRLRARGSSRFADLVLDQGFVAGIGNKYKSELLFELGLNPFRRARALEAPQADRLVRAIPALLKRGYQLGGRTRELAAGEPGNSWNHKHYVFRRGGRPCWRCGTTVVTDRKRSLRVTFFCPRCQDVPSAPALKASGVEAVAAHAPA